jgi:anti-sigma-K factor RskA
MASYSNPELRDRLAAEYVLGTLTGRARARFQALLRYDRDLKRTVADWEERLSPLALAATGIAPPRRVWQAVERRIQGTRPRAGWWESLALWRTIAVTSTTFVFALSVVIGMAPRPEPPMSTVAVMADERGQPAMVVSWAPMKAMRDPHVRVKIVQEHPTMAPTTSWELWMLPGGSAAPVSLGLVSLDTVQVVKLPPALAGKMAGAWGMAMSVEPAGGSPTGAPTGPVIFKGQCVKVL